MKHTYQKLLQISLLSLILTGCQSLSSETGGKTELPSEKPVESTSIMSDKKTEEVTDSPFESDTSSATEEEKTNRVNTAKSEFKGKEIVDGNIFNNNIKEDNKNNIYYYKLSTQDLIDMGLKNVKSDEKNGYYIVKYNLQDSTIEIYNTEGFDDEGNVVYSLTDIKQVRLK